MIDVKKLFPNLSEVYTEEGVDETFLMAAIIERLCFEMGPQEIKHFLKFIDGGRWHDAFIMFREEMKK
ncbi:hypothetical protein [Paenibacillus sp. LjRoot56]|uniref:hypothetical protein n=1 Tax=Paenibacillus sp. LjRoot56 TaxID=3342333 RepID=UPI003ECEE13D